MKYTLILCLLAFSLKGFAQIPCSLDATFDADGLMVSDGSRLGEHILIQDDGKILVACNPFGNGNAYIRRFNADGSVDATYGSSGKCVVSVMEIATHINDMVFYGGNVFIVGTTSTNIGGTNTYPYVTKVSSGGTIVSTFGTAGVRTFPSLWLADGIAVDNNGKIYFCGDNLTKMYVYRLNTDGSNDNTFDSDGEALFNTGSSSVWYDAADLQVDDAGNVIVAGKKFSSSSSTPSYWNLMAMRLLPNGSLDNSFGTSGMAFFNYSTDQYDEAHQVHLSGDGYVLCGNGYNGSDYDYLSLKLDHNGALDNTYGSAGWSVNDLTLTGDQENCLNSAVLPDGRILMTGNQGDGDTVRFALLMLNADGSRDASFATNGVFTNIFNVNNNSSSSGMGLTSTGKIVLAGYTRTCSGGVCGPLSMAVSRYNSSYGPTGIDQLQRSDFHIYPNPASANSRITVTGKGIRQVMLYNCTGQVIPCSYTDGELSIPDVSAGIYQLNIQAAGGQVNQALEIR